MVSGPQIRGWLVHINWLTVVYTVLDTQIDLQ